jgi:hypothetical protein
MKIGRQSMFHPHEEHILARLDITVLYTILFEVFRNIEFRLLFYQKYLFIVKTSKKSVFQSLEAHILSRLDISVMYIKF